MENSGEEKTARLRRKVSLRKKVSPDGNLADIMDKVSGKIAGRRTAGIPAADMPAQEGGGRRTRIRPELVGGKQERRPPRGIGGGRIHPGRMLLQLSSDEEPVVRELVASNPSAPEEALARPAKDGDCLVRAAGNASIPVEALAELAGDEDCLVRLAAAGNPHTRNDVLERMSDTDGSQEVRETASYAMEKRNYRTETKGPQSPDLAPPTREGEERRRARRRATEA